MNELETVDAEIGSLLLAEEERQGSSIQLIASENFASRAVMAAQGSVATNKYAEGLPGKRYYGGCVVVDKIEQLALDRVKGLYQAEYANVQPHSGSSANFAVYHALLKPGDTILGMDLNAGGHLTHGHPVNQSGKNYKAVHYGVDSNGRIDYQAVKSLAIKHKPKLIIAGFSAYSQVIDWGFFAAVAKECGAYFLADMAHVSGLIATGDYPSPIPHADVVTSTTHKTLRGPRGGMILSKSKEIGRLLDRAVFPGMQGGPLMHVIAAKAVCYHEAMTEEFKAYQKQVILNAQAMAKCFMDNNFVVVSGLPQCHMFLLSLDGSELNGMQAQSLFEKAGIIVNKNSIPNDPLPPNLTSGVRIGTPAMTTRGMSASDAENIAGMMVKLLRSPHPETVDEVIKDVQSLLATLPTL